MRDKKMEQSIKVIALILLFGAFILHTPLSISKRVDKNDVLPHDINNVAQQEKDSCLSFKFDEIMNYRFIFEKSDSLYHNLNSPQD